MNFIIWLMVLKRKKEKNKKYLFKKFNKFVERSSYIIYIWLDNLSKSLFLLFLWYLHRDGQSGPGTKIFFCTGPGSKLFTRQDRDQKYFLSGTGTEDFFWPGPGPKIFSHWERDQNFFLTGTKTFFSLGPGPKIFSDRGRDQKRLVPLMSIFTSSIFFSTITLIDHLTFVMKQHVHWYNYSNRYRTYHR